jgi:hypothetical protein
VLTTRKAAVPSLLARLHNVEFLPRARSQFRRRDILRLAALASLSTVSAACGTQSNSQQPDPLEALWRQAREDSTLAQAIATAHTDLAPQASMVARLRGEHATALRREIDRANPSSQSQPSTSAKPTPSPSAPATSSAATAVLTDNLRTAGGQAANLAPTAPWYRTGLLGSISASCASLIEVMA